MKKLLGFLMISPMVIIVIFLFIYLPLSFILFVFFNFAENYFILNFFGGIMLVLEILCLIIYLAEKGIKFIENK